ncbi:MAG: phosphoesterase PA-phosphatase [Nitratiruptor sp.]|nr:phosphoesterase PA-phosphatase [Nitratiruptor sp.]NPA83904.1 phosphatase PAP2 family protein [Campylobacterota bacterium]
MVLLRLGLLLLPGCFLFLLFPQIDLYGSSLFFDGEGFPLHKAPLPTFIYHATIVITTATALLLLLFLFFPQPWLSRKEVVYLLLVLLLGPGLIVNVGLKNTMGRARPSQIIQFGGEKEFTPALVPADECQRNCSFTSGHAAAAFYFLAFVPLVRGRWRRLLLAGALAWGWIVGIGRIVQGGHFLSDVYCSLVIDLLVAGALYYLLFERSRNGALGGHSGHE